MTGDAAQWVDVGSVDDLRRRRKQLADVDGTQVALFLHGDEVHALANICIHRQRELVKGVILNGRVICPGHQWAFDLATGFNERYCRYQPAFDVRIDGGRVLVRAEPREVPAAQTPPAPSDETAIAEP